MRGVTVSRDRSTEAEAERRLGHSGARDSASPGSNSVKIRVTMDSGLRPSAGPGMTERTFPAVR